MDIQVSQIKKFLVIKIEGEINKVEHANQFEQFVIRKIKEGNLFIVVDFLSTVYIDSGAVNALTICYNSVQEKKGKLWVVCKDKEILNLFHIVGLDQLIRIYSDWDNLEKDVQ